METIKFLRILRQKIQFLQKIDDNIYFQLGVKEFILPNKNLEEVREEMEKVFDKYVMTYKANFFDDSLSLGRHLCSHLKPATISDEQKMLLEHYEKIWKPKGVSFCLYQKPIEYINGSKSPVAKQCITSSI